MKYSKYQPEGLYKTVLSLPTSISNNILFLKNVISTCEFFKKKLEFQLRFEAFEKFRIYCEIIRVSPGSCKLEVGMSEQTQRTHQMCYARHQCGRMRTPWSRGALPSSCWSQ